MNQGNAFGNLGRNAVIGPGWSNLDLALEKNTRVTERFTSPVPGRCVRRFNQIQLPQSDTTIGIFDPGHHYRRSYAMRRATSGTSRQMQLSAKLTF